MIVSLIVVRPHVECQPSARCSKVLVQASCPKKDSASSRDVNGVGRLCSQVAIRAGGRLPGKPGRDIVRATEPAHLRCAFTSPPVSKTWTG
ncbi:hypothetical protein SCNRRL3882_0159 [Streptomyces chartreusis NRRL 3882]|uniref:Uncharacterized protein n=1 Tax=Streptomyces chartreusis NRRL 3882 TaxID=1079985 RepID=A0A2N9B019_STRCX|nr:hypothetical protein SCNRRL3882_0159 [Streptomyces chartreusis NRRL 3882]